MKTYRIYVMCRDGGRLPHQDLDCADHEAAFMVAAELARDARSAEVWTGTELLGEIRAARTMAHYSVPPISFPNRMMVAATSS